MTISAFRRLQISWKKYIEHFFPLHTHTHKWMLNQNTHIILDGRNWAWQKSIVTKDNNKAWLLDDAKLSKYRHCEMTQKTPNQTWGWINSTKERIIPLCWSTASGTQRLLLYKGSLERLPINKTTVKTGDVLVKHKVFSRRGAFRGYTSPPVMTVCKRNYQISLCFVYIIKTSERYKKFGSSLRVLCYFVFLGMACIQVNGTHYL